jgi:hypothetical protein
VRPFSLTTGDYMARSAIPDFGIEYPPYVYHPFPRYIGLDAEGEVLTANSEEEARRLKEIAVFPKLMGKDKNGNDVIAQIPRDLEWLKAKVVTPPEDPAIAKKREDDRLFAESEVKRKADAYDKLMAEQSSATDDPIKRSPGRPAKFA